MKGRAELPAHTVVRVHKRTNPYVMVERATAQDKRLSWAARGLLVYLLSLPADWQINVRHLQEQGDVGRDVIRRLLRELQSFGYASGFGKPDAHCEGGKFGGSEIAVYESPDLNPHFTAGASPKPAPTTPESPTPETQASAVPTPESQSPYKRKSLQNRDSTKHTHTQAPRARGAAPPESAAAGVRVSESQSRFSFEVRKAYAEAKGLGGGWLHNSRDGRYDELIATWLESKQPEAVERALLAPPSQHMPYRTALLHIGSILDVDPGLDIAAAVTRLDVSDEDRGRLLAFDFSKRRADARQAQPAAFAHTASYAPAASREG